MVRFCKTIKLFELFTLYNVMTLYDIRIIQFLSKKN